VQERVVLCLELETADTERFYPLRMAMAQKGIRFRTLSAEQALHPDTWLSRFAEMDNATRTADRFMPRTPEEIALRIADFGQESVGCIVADDGTRLMGYTVFHRAAGDDARRARQGWTGVRPEYRRCGIATALKVEGILLARRLGYARLVTDPRADNIASIRMSCRVGFHPCDSDTG
jgi:RimJ/RimL family protein N-acetyltransferase